MDLYLARLRSNHSPSLAAVLHTNAETRMFLILRMANSGSHCRGRMSWAVLGVILKLFAVKHNMQSSWAQQ